MDINMFDFIRDVTVIAYMLVLRIGVPLLIVVFCGTALKKWLDKPSAEVEQPVRGKKQAEEQGKMEEAPVVIH